jgi:hypothetical protein
MPIQYVQYIMSVTKPTTNAFPLGFLGFVLISSIFSLYLCCGDGIDEVKGQ